MNVNEYIASSEDPWNLKRIGKNRKIVKMLGQEIGMAGKVLDVGGGYGFYADALRELGNTTVVLDNSKKMIREGEALFPLVDFVRGDATNMPFANAAFDAAMCMGTLMYINNKDAFFSEVHRVLKPSGKLFLYERNKNDILNRIVSVFKNTEKPSDSADMFLEKSQIEMMAEKHRFSVKKMRGTGRTFLAAVLIKE